MNIIANNVTKLLVAFVAAAMLFTVAMPAQAQTLEDLLATLAEVQAQIDALGGADDSAPAAGACTFTRSLSDGSEGADVTCLQDYLTSTGHFTFAGGSTGYFGPVTTAAVAAWQAANGVAPAVGYFGPVSQAKYNELMMDAPDMPDMDDDDMDDDDMSLSGEGTLAKFEVDDDEDEVMEGEEDVVVMLLTLEAEDGDLELSRLTFELNDGGVVNTEDDPWDVFEEVALWVDGDKVADFEADDEDNYLDEDAGEFRFSGLDLFLPEDDEVEIAVAVSVVGDVDDADSATLADWVLFAMSARVFDADGVADTSSTIDEMGDSESFTIVSEGVDDDADVESNSDNPDAANLEVEDDSGESDEYTVHVFDIEVDEDSSDLVLDDAIVEVTVGNPAGAAASIEASDVIADIFLTIDGETIDGEANVDGDDEDTIAAGATDTVDYKFEFDGFDLEADTDYEVKLSVVFEGQDDGANYENGVTFASRVVGSTWEVEGLDSDNVLTGSDNGETHTLFATGITVEVDSAETDVTTGDTAGDDTVDFKWTLSITAFGEEDVFITSEFANIVDALAGATDAEIAYEIEQTGGAALTSVSGTITSDADEVTGDTGAYGGDYSGETFFQIDAGSTEEFDITISASNATDSKQVQAYLEAIEWTTDEVDDDSGDSDALTGAVESYTSELDDDTETGYETIN